MIRAVVYDIGGTLHTITKRPGQAERFCQLLLERLEDYGICLPTTPEELAPILHENTEEYKTWSEISRVELPTVRIWNEYYLKQFEIGEARLAPISEELSFRYDYDRLTLMRRPHLVETIETLDSMGLLQGIISNIISTSFVPHMLKEYGVDGYMKSVVMSSTAGARKPEAAIFARSAAELGIKLNEMAYVGDTISRDVMGARNAGIGCMIQINNPSIAYRDRNVKDSGYLPDYLIEDLAEIPAIIKTYQ